MVWGDNVFYRSCKLVACDGNQHIQSGRRLVALEPLPAGVDVIRQRGVTVPTPYLPDPLNALYQQRGQEQLMPLTSQLCCPICFARSGQHADDPRTCATLAALLAPVEGVLYPRIQEHKASLKVDDTLLRLWLRVVALVCINRQPQDPKAAEYIATWTEAIQQCSQLDTSAPDSDWIADVFVAANTFAALLEPQHVQALQETLCPAIAISQTTQRETTGADDADVSATAAATTTTTTTEAPGARKATPSPPPPVSVAEALVVLAGQVNCNGYSVRLPTSPNTLVGLGFFPAIAMANHACAPNCAVVTRPGGVLAVVTLQPIRKHQELTVSYVDLLRPRAHRRKYLLSSKNFHCRCLRCQHPDAYPNDRALTLPLCAKCACLPRWSLPAPSQGGGLEAGEKRMQPRPQQSEGAGSSTRAGGTDTATGGDGTSKAGAQRDGEARSGSAHGPGDSDEDEEKQEHEAWTQQGYVLTCWTEDGGCGCVLPPSLADRVLPPLHDAIDRCQQALTRLTRWQLSVAARQKQSESEKGKEREKANAGGEAEGQQQDDGKKTGKGSEEANRPESEADSHTSELQAVRQVADSERQDQALIQEEEQRAREQEQEQEVKQLCADVITHAQQVLASSVDKTVSPAHHSVIQLQCVLFALCARTGHVRSGVAALVNAVHAMERYLPAPWPELNEWRLRLLEAHSALVAQQDKKMRQQQQDMSDKKKRKGNKQKQQSKSCGSDGKQNQMSEDGLGGDVEDAKTALLLSGREQKQLARDILKATRAMCGEKHPLHARAVKAAKFVGVGRS